MPLPLSDSDSGSIFLWALVLILCVLALFVAVVFLKRWLKSDDISSPGPGFTLSDLRQLVAEGKMTTEEFEKAKLAILGATKAAPAKAPPANSAMNPPIKRPKQP
jgi:hypothetical protein